jgi:hypothetical protein
MAPALAANRTAEDDLGVASYFEVHVRRDERWTIDRMAPTAGEAVAEAEDIAKRADVTAVKVVNERYNPRIDQSAGRIIFKLEKPERRRRSGHMRLMASPRVPPPAPAAQPSESPLAIASLPPPATSPPPAPAARTSGGPAPRGAPRGPQAPTAPWLLFAWASLALALGASALFVFLLVIG